MNSSSTRQGVALGLSAYALWGLFPLYWPLLEPAGAIEVLSHRIIWSFVVTGLLLAVLRGWKKVAHLPLRTWGLIVVAAVMIAFNWGIYIYATTNGHVVEAALGYFINPLLSAALGVLVMKERMRPLQWAALATATVAVLIITIGSGQVPWLALSMAASFALYGLVKKVIPMTPVESLTVESGVLVPVALIFLVALQIQGTSSFTGNGAGHIALLIAAGVVTAIPLLLFGSAAQKLPLSMLGFLQYLTPTIQFLLGVYWAHEVMAPSRWIGFAVIWLALALYSYDAVRHTRRSRAARRV